MDDVITIQGLKKIFFDLWKRPKATALKGIDLHVSKGEVFGLLGPNGSGKSTTIKILLGLLFPTQGLVKVLGMPPHTRETKHHIGYLPEETYLYSYLNAEETLHFYAALFAMPKTVARKRVEELLKMVGLYEVRNRRVGEYSKGMARRLGIAQALINDPDLIILDEPTSGLDPIGCREVKDLIIMLGKRGKTIFMTSHLLADVEDVCTRVAILYNGTVYAEGTVSSILTRADMTQIRVKGMQPEEEKTVASLLRKKHADTDIEVSNPTRSMESFFLDVIQNAQLGKTTETDQDAQKSAVPADRTSEEAEDPDAILERLTRTDDA